MPDSSVLSSPPEPPADPTAAPDPTDGGPAPERPAAPHPLGRRRLVLLMVPIVALIIASNVGDALTTTLAPSHPLALVALNARSRILVLVTNQLDAFSYYGMATLRLMVSDPLFFLLGLWYGDAAVAWMERRTRTWGSTMRQLERWFGKAAYPLVFLAPNNIICLLAGAAGMSVTGFFIANLAGTVVRLYAIRVVGASFEAPIDDLLGFLSDHRMPLLIGSLALLALTSLLELKRGDSELDAVLHLDDELEPEPDQDTRNPGQ